MKLSTAGNRPRLMSRERAVRSNQDLKTHPDIGDLSRYPFNVLVGIAGTFPTMCAPYSLSDHRLMSRGVSARPCLSTAAEVETPRIISFQRTIVTASGFSENVVCMYLSQDTRACKGRRLAGTFAGASVRCPSRSRPSAERRCACSRTSLRTGRAARARAEG